MLYYYYLWNNFLFKFIYRYSFSGDRRLNFMKPILGLKPKVRNSLNAKFRSLFRSTVEVITVNRIGNFGLNLDSIFSPIEFDVFLTVNIVL